MVFLCVLSIMTSVVNNVLSLCHTLCRSVLMLNIYFRWKYSNRQKVRHTCQCHERYAFLGFSSRR